VCCATFAILSTTACGGGGSGSSAMPQTFTVMATSGAGGSVSPSSAAVSNGNTATFTITPSAGYGIGAATGCGGTLAGNVYTTGAISGGCTVSASFSALGPIWEGGSDTREQAGVYGTQGQPAASNVPGERSGAVTWTDASGNFWLFGGDGYSRPLPNSYAEDLNDLWKYDVATREWTWMSGSNSVGANGVYGSLGQPAATNVPGARQGAIGWTDAGGNLWLFGGNGYDATNAGYGTLGDLWEYRPSTGEWTWQGGPDTEADPTTAQGVYGTEGQPAASNLPGPRSSAMTWTDVSGNFWMFGGIGYDSIGIFGDLNDLWEYSPSSGEWTWKSGCNLSGCVDGFGGLGQTAPGARDSAVAWTDGSGNFWLFGGSGVDTHENTGTLNDLWKYTLTTGAWTLEGGSMTFGSINGFAGVYGTLGQSATTNMPGSRYGGVGWTDASGNLWLFGGNGYDSAATFEAPFQGWLNDLWKYDPSTTNWTWEGGSNLENASGVYGTLGQPAATNVPGSRFAAAVSTDTNHNVWLFGGYGYDSASLGGGLNDLWLLQSSSSRGCSGFGCR
jgi:hypothetical protein